MSALEQKLSGKVWLGGLARALLVALLYFLAARLSLAFVLEPAGLAAIWPPSGLLLAFLLLSAPAGWPLILAAAAAAIVAANLLAGNPPLTSLGFAVANIAESSLAAWLLGRFAPRPLTFASLGQVIRFFLIAVIGSNALTACLGAAVPALGLGAPFWVAWQVWWVADGLGMLLVGSAILIWAGPAAPPLSLSRGRLVEAALGLGLLAATGQLIFGVAPEQALVASPYLAFPLLLWASLRLGPRGASGAALLLAAIAVYNTAAGRGPFAALDLPPALQILEVQAFLLVESLTALVLAAVTAERTQAQADLRRANEALEQRVAARTAELTSANARLRVESDERQRAAARSARLQSITAGLSAARMPAQVAAVMIEQGVAALDAAAGSVFLLSPDGAELELAAAAGYRPEELEGWRRIPAGAPVPLAEAARSSRPIWVENRAQLLALYPPLAQVTGRDSALVALPLVAHGAALGAIGLTFGRPRSFSPDDRHHMQALVDLCAQALERARLYEREQQSRAEAEHDLRLRDQFLVIAAHELKTPLTSLLGFGELLQRRAGRIADLSPRDLNAINQIVEQANRLDRLMDGMFEATRLQEGQLTLNLSPCDLGALMVEAAGELEPVVAAHALSLHRDPRPLPVSADPHRLKQVIYNLVRNAAKYSPAGARIALTAEPVGAEARLTVLDEGIGIPAAALPRIFDRFYRASNVDALKGNSGMGVGLYIVHEIVRRHGGRVEVTSSEGVGSCFTVYLPLLGPPEG